MKVIHYTALKNKVAAASECGAIKAGETYSFPGDLSKSDKDTLLVMGALEPADVEPEPGVDPTLIIEEAPEPAQKGRTAKKGRRR